MHGSYIIGQIISLNKTFGWSSTQSAKSWSIQLLDKSILAKSMGAMVTAGDE